MSLALSVLIVEDSQDDTLLMVRELQRNGYSLTYERVDTHHSMDVALDRQSWDLVIADYSLPQFSAPAALKLLQTKNLDLPFIIVSGNIGEDRAVAAMKAGAHDYLMKGNLARLVPAIDRELREARERSQRRAAEQALRANEERFRSLIENALDIITVLDEHATVRYVSPSIERVLGYTPEDFIGHPLFHYIHPEDREAILTAFKTAMQTSGQTVLAEIKFRHQDGSWRIMEAIGKQFTESTGATSVVINSRDITERKQVEETRKTLQKEKELNDLKSQFISMVSHEFRTPLSVIVLSSSLLERFFNVATQEKRQEYLTRIQAAAKHMTQLLDDVLFMGKTAAGKQEFKPAPLDLVQFCQEMLEEMQLASNPQRAITFICPEVSIPAYMDEGLLRHILTNLLSNALKYSSAGTIVQFELTHDDVWATFQIQDQGIGISEEDQQHLFQSFHRGQNVGRISGTGLGLAIVQQSVHLHGGTINIQSKINVGTTFKVKLPLNR
ncbi:MAG: ATP-binding protein [Kovacikia sp.]